MKKYLKIFSLIIIGLVIFSCGVTKPVVIEKEYITILKDSTVYNYKDSTIIIPIERIVDIVPEYDTLKLETSLATSIAYVDTNTHSLKGSIENKKGVQYKIIEKEHIKYQTDTTYVYEEKPVYVDKEIIKHPKYEKYLWFISIISLTYFILKFIYFLKNKHIL